MTPEERFNELARAPLFEGLAEPVLREIADQATSLAVPAHGNLPLQARQTPLVFLIVSGSVHLSLISASGREFVVTIAGRGEVLGELDTSGRSQSALIATTQEPTRLLRIRWDTLRQTGAGAELLRRCNTLLAERLRWLQDIVEDLALYPLDARLARVLARLHARSSSHAVMRLHRLNQNTLAQMTNATRPKVNQYLQVFQRLGAIELDAGSVRIRDDAALLRIAQQGV